MKPTKFSDLKDGQSFTVKINGISTFGKITIEGSHVYLCQNDEDGNKPRDLKGYKYAWSIGYTYDDFDTILRRYNIIDLTIVEDDNIPIEDLVEGEYYHCHDEAGFIIFKFLERNNKDKNRPKSDFYITTMGNNELRKNTELWYTGRNGRKATKEEKDWLDYCIEQNKFVDISEMDLKTRLVSSNSIIMNSIIDNFVGIDIQLDNTQSNLREEELLLLL